MLRNDFNFIIDLKRDFFAQRSIQQLLAAIEKNGTAGWEPWWRVEFARFLYRHQHKHEWAREHLIKAGRTKGVLKDKLTADFMIKPRNRAGNRPILIELKQSDSVEGCIANMAENIRSMEKTKSVSGSQRSFWVVGAHPRECKNTVRKTVESVATEYGIEIFDVQTRYILNTGYAFTVF